MSEEPPGKPLRTKGKNVFKQLDMYKEDYEGGYSHDRSGDEIYSKPVRAGKRTYFFDVKSTKGNNDFYLTITESKRRMESDGRFSYDRTASSFSTSTRFSYTRRISRSLRRDCRMP